MGFNELNSVEHCIIHQLIGVRAELENKEDILISIYSNKNVLVFQQTTEEENSFVQSFNLNQLPKGQYEVFVSSEYFEERIRITQ